jgi:hypothetical protein
MKANLNIGLSRIQALLGVSRAAALCAIFLITLTVLFAAFWFFHSATPDTITITTGPEGSVFQTNAAKYRAILARNGVKLKILPSEGSLENLRRLVDPKFRVDVGFVQGGESDGLKIDKLFSLGSVSYAPILVFYRDVAPVDLLSGFNGKRLAIGPAGSGTQSLALTLLAANGIGPGGSTALLDLDADDAAKALLDSKVDAVFLMGESASLQTIRSLLLTPGIRMFDFTQADGYTRRIVYLNKLELPKGSIDFGKDIPDHALSLIGPTVELIAREGLDPALSDLLLEAAREVHGTAGLLRQRGEFPAPLEHEFRISSEAVRYYKSGKSFLYRSLPFWLASLVNRIIVAVVPIIVLLVPGLRLIPAFYRWRIMLRFYRWYRELLVLEQDMVTHVTPEIQKKLLERLYEIEKAVNRMKVPASFANQFYVLREHISFVRDRLIGSKQA